MASPECLDIDLYVGIIYFVAVYNVHLDSYTHLDTYSNKLERMLTFGKTWNHVAINSNLSDNKCFIWVIITMFV